MHDIQYIKYVNSLAPRKCGSDFNSLRLRPNRRHFADDTFKHIFMKENVRISIKISLKFVPKSPIDNILALFQIMAWRWPGDKPLSETMMVSLLTHICVARPQWVKRFSNLLYRIVAWAFAVKLLTGKCHRNSNEKSTLVQSLVWSCQAVSHYLSQCWPRSMWPYGIPRPQWFKVGFDVISKYHVLLDLFAHIWDEKLYIK